ncbi:hypothetical protein TCON_2732 [Astathelohania contejeani]|uniref:Uncharacterized protein n=1 Tax=Astathelohania contejeani TaxID=164912 RepID=A0ABQ7HV60_9MICR|nr:hypothetical protein TCON_2732 [Thelohania contejeani]
MGIITHVLKRYIVISKTEMFSGEKPLLHSIIVARKNKTIDHLATGYDRILGHDYTRRHNEVLKCIHLLLMNKYGFKKTKKLRSHSVQEIAENDLAEIRVDTRIRTDILVKHNRPDIFIYDKKENMVILVEIGITSQDNLQQVEVEKKKI